MKSIARRLLPALSLLAALALLPVACGHDVTTPEGSDAWEAVSLSGIPTRGELLGLAFSGSGALAVGVTVEGAPPSQHYTPLAVAPDTAGAWRGLSAGWLPARGYLTTVGFSAAGAAIVAGVDVQPPGTGFILDERGGWSRLDVPFGGLAFSESGGELRLGGSGAGNAAVRVSTAADTWGAESLPFPSGAAGGERGLRDIDGRNGVWAACGFDDGADGSPESPHGVLFLKSGGAWGRLSVPCGGCGDREFRSVAVTPTGGLLLGGAITDFGAGAADDYVAFLLLRSPGGDWAEIVLPGAGTLDRVNDILVGSDGTVWLACGLDRSSCILRTPHDGPTVCAVTLAHARVARLAEAPGGGLYAVGALVDTADPDARTPALWRRTE